MASSLLFTGQSLHTCSHPAARGCVPRLSQASCTRQLSFNRLRKPHRASVLTQAVQQEAAEASPSPSQCEDAREAIAVGQGVFAAGDWQKAAEYFEKALDLPGTGTKRFRDKPPLPSPGEKQAAMYNLACCYSKLGEVHTGLVALAGCLENGYRNVDQVRGDPDLEQLRQDPRFEGLIKRLVPLASSGVLGRLINNLTLGKQ